MIKDWFILYRMQIDVLSKSGLCVGFKMFYFFATKVLSKLINYTNEFLPVLKQTQI